MACSASKTIRHQRADEVCGSVLLAAFDAYPGLKGAQAHIRANLAALSKISASVRLICLGAGDLFLDPHSGAEMHTFRTYETNLLRRSELFAAHVRRTADRMLAAPPAIIHFRDIWSGMPLLSHPISRTARTIFEVNGLPSVEMSHHAPGILYNPELMARLRRMERECLTRADRIITISRRTAAFLQELGIPPGKIRVIPNTAGQASDIGSAEYPCAGIFEDAKARGVKVLLYAGTLAPWQGVDTMLRALAFLRHRTDLHLVMAASSRKWSGRIRRQLDLLQISGMVTLLTGIDHTAMPDLYAGSYLSLAPLARGARNEIQGCCPLKIVESMACATPVLASDLPVVRELVRHGEDGWLVPPDSPRALAGAASMLLDDQSLRDRLSRAARNTAGLEFGQELFSGNLRQLYQELDGPAP